MKVEITRFRVKKGKTAQVDAWLNFLNAHLGEIELTLVDEKMYVETIFRETLDGVEYLYWYSVQGDGGASIENSSHAVDKQHLAYWRECIDSDFVPVNLKTEVVMIQKKIQAVME